MYTDNKDGKQVEDWFTGSNNILHYLADFTYDWEYWLNPEGKLVYISPSCERITGYHSDAFIKESWPLVEAGFKSSGGFRCDSLFF